MKEITIKEKRSPKCELVIRLAVTENTQKLQDLIDRQIIKHFGSVRFKSGKRLQKQSWGYIIENDYEIRCYKDIIDYEVVEQ